MKKKTFTYTLSLHLRGVKELHKITPKLFTVMVLHAVVAGLIPYVTVFFSARILKELAVSANEELLWNWVFACVLSAGSLGVLKAWLNQRFTTLFDDMWGRKEILFCRKTFSLDFADIDKQQTHDLRNQIRQNEQWSGWGLTRIPRFLEKFMQSVIGIAGGTALCVSLFISEIPETAGVLTILNHPIFILLFTATMLFISLLAGRFYAKSVRSLSEVAESATFGNRLFGFFGFLGSQKERSSDIRIYQQNHLIDIYYKFDNTWGIKGPIFKAAKGPVGIYGGLSLSLSTLTIGFVYVFTCLKAWGGAFGIGSITQYVGAATALASNIHTFLRELGNMETNTSYLEKTFEYLDIPNTMYQGSLTTEKRADRQYEVEFKNVSFKYPGSELWALKNVSMKFTVGKRLAIVGENGSGKTTFIKLLCRLYDPQKGQILLNGIDIRKYNYCDYMNIFSVVFQDFQLISQPLGSNVAGSVTYDEEKVQKVLMDAGFGERLKTLPYGLNTQLYKEFTENGIEISGGEAQKIAIARALYKNAPFIILDEPTAALDPIAEAEIYAKLNEIIDDKTAVYISHRLSSCKFCDEILVFHEGKMIQQGSHEVLLAEDQGKYYELWQAQAQYYQVGV
mgnify:CR=1 FL=1